MGTRGTITYKFKGKTATQYNHFDSYPRGLGQNLVDQIKKLLNEVSLSDLADKLEKLRVVNDETTPTAEDIANIVNYTNIAVNIQNTNDWYSLLCGCQGNIKSIIDSGYIYNGGDDMKENCNYVLDFDTRQFYMKESETKYDLFNIPNNWIELLD